MLAREPYRVCTTTLFTWLPVGCHKARRRGVTRAEYEPSHVPVRGNTSVFRSSDRGNACERVLRYVDGKERRIRYPCNHMAEDDASVVCTEQRCDRQVDTLEQRENEECHERSRMMHGERSRGDVVGSTSVVETGESGDGQSRQSETVQQGFHVGTAASPLDFLRHVTSQEYIEQQSNEYETVKEAFFVAVDGCPWPVPRPVYTIVVSDTEDDQHSLYTLRTRLYQDQVESELHSLLFSRRKDPIIRCSSLVDGVVMFQSHDAAVEYGEMVESRLGENLSKRVHIAEHDSHSLFRAIVEAKGIAVVMKEGCVVPDPQKLKAVLLDRTPS